MVGSNALPGTYLSDTAGYSVILPFAFSANLTLTQFSVFFATNNSVHLEVWRPNGTNQWYIIFDQEVTAPTANQLNVVPVLSCAHVMAGDQIGFSTLNGPSSVAYNIDPQSYYTFNLRPVASTQAFTTTYLPFIYSISAQYQSGFTC